MRDFKRNFPSDLPSTDDAHRDATASVAPLSLNENSIAPQAGTTFVRNNLLVAESDLAWGSDKNHVRDNADRPEADESRAEGSLSFTCHGGVNYLLLNGQTLLPAHDFPFDVRGSEGTLTIQELVKGTNGQFTLRYSYALHDNVSHSHDRPWAELEFKMTFVGKDDKGQTQNIQAIIDVGVMDDAPVTGHALADEYAVMESGPFAGLLGSWGTMPVEYGADGKAAENAFRIAYTPDDEIVFENPKLLDNGYLEVPGNHGILYFNPETGAYFYNVHASAATDEGEWKDVFRYFLADGDGSSSGGRLEFLNSGEVRPPVEVEQAYDEFLVAESDLSWGSDRYHTENLVGRDGDESKVERTLTFSCPGGVENISLEGNAGIEDRTFSPSDFPYTATVDGLGKITFLGLSESANGEYGLRYSFVLTDNISHAKESNIESEEISFKINGKGEGGIPVRVDATLVVNVFDDAPKQMDFRYESPGLVTPEEGPFAGLPGVEGKALIDYGADGKGNESPATGEIPAFRIGAVFDGEYVQSEGETDDNGYIRVPGELGALYINPETGEYFYHVHSPIGPDDHWKDIFSYTLTDADGSETENRLEFVHGGKGIVDPNLPPDQNEYATVKLIVAESDLSWGSDKDHQENNVGRPGTDETQTEGKLEFYSPGGVDSIILDGVTVDIGQAFPSVHTTSFGALTLKALHPLHDGKYAIEYSYQLYENVMHRTEDYPGDTEFKMTILGKDTEGQNKTIIGTIKIEVEDDVPVCSNVSVDPDEYSRMQSGMFSNLYGVEGKVSVEYGADFAGTDAAFRVASNSSGSYKDKPNSDGYIAVEGQYGQLFINPETGDYFYHLHSAVDSEDMMKDSFTYVLTDADGSSSRGNLSFTHGGSTGPSEPYSTVVVAESDLGWGTDRDHECDNAGRPGTDESVAQGRLEFSFQGDIEGFSIDGVSISLDGLPANYRTTFGNISLDGLEPMGNGQYCIRYTYTLKENVTHDSPDVVEAERINVVIHGKDANGKQMDVLGPIVVKVEDDAPVSGYELVGAKDYTEVIDGPFAGKLGYEGSIPMEYGADGKSADLPFRITFSSDLKGDGNYPALTPNSDGYLEVSGKYGSLYINPETGDYFYQVHSPAANDGTIVKDHFVYVLTDADGTAAQGGLQFSHGGEVKPPVQVEQLQDEFLVAESDLAWGSDSGHEANNVGREGEDESRVERSLTFSCPGGVDNISIEGNAGIDNKVLSPSDFPYTTSVDGLGEITLLGLTRSDNGEYNLRYSFVLKENLVHDDPSVPEEAKIFFKINGANENGAPLRIDATLIVDIFDDAPAMKDIWYESPDLAISHSGHFVGLLGVEGGLGFDFGADGKSSGATPSFRIGYGPMDVESQYFESVPDETGYIEIPGELGRLYVNPETGHYFYHVHSPLGPDADWRDVFTYVLTDADGSQTVSRITFVHGGDGIVDPNLQRPILILDPIYDTLVVAESDLAWGSDRNHTEDNAGRPGTDESRIEQSLTFSFPGEVASITVLTQFGEIGLVINPADFPSSVFVDGCGEITFLGFDALDDGKLSLRYSVALLKNLTHAQDGTPETIGVTFSVNGIAEDGQKIRQDADLTINIKDDAPMLAPETLADTMTLVETADDWGLGMHGNWLDMNAVYGADGKAEENALVVGFAREGEDPEYQGFSENGDIVIQGDYGTLYLYENGSYSYIMSPNLAHEFLDRTYTETFSYQLTDADGSQTSGNFSVKFGGDNIDFESLPTLFGDDTDDTLNIEYDALVVGGAGDELILMGNSSYSVVYGREGVDRFGWDTENFVEGRDFIQDMSVFPGETIILSNLLSDGQTLDDFLENNITNAHGDYDGVYFTLNYNGVERDVTMHFAEQKTASYTDWIDLYVSQAGEWEHDVIAYFLKSICE